MQLKTNHSFIKDFLLSLITFGAWKYYKLFSFLEEGKVFYPKAKTLWLILGLFFFPFLFVVVIQYLKIVSRRRKAMLEAGLTPQTSVLRLVLSHLFGWATLFIWPLVEKILLYRLWNASNALVNQKLK